MAAVEMTFDEAFRLVVGAEGGFSDDPEDNGGATKFGVTRATLSAYRGYVVTVDDVRALSIDEARDIYRKHYWDALRCDELPAWLRLLAFDAGVNSGVRAAALWLQNSVGAKADGNVGPVTVRLSSIKKREDVLPDFVAQRLLLMANHADFKRFGKGWFRRVVLKILEA